MTTNRRRRFTADFKKRVALEALRGDRTVQVIAAKHEVHPNQVGTWKRQAIEGLDEVFARGGSPGPSEHEATIGHVSIPAGRTFPPPACQLAFRSTAQSPIRMLGGTIAWCSTWPNARASGSWSSATTAPS